MKLYLSQNLLQTFPEIAVSVVVVKNIQNERKSSSVRQLLDGVCATRKQELKTPDKKEALMAVCKKGHHNEGVLPEFRLLENLLTKVGKGTPIEMKENLSAIAKYWLLKKGFPLFGYDLDAVEKDLVLDFDYPKKGQKIQDFEFTPQTKHTVFWLINSEGKYPDKFQSLAEDLALTLQKYSKGTVELLAVVSASQPEVDLEYTSEKEVLYKEEQEKLAAEREHQEKIMATNDLPFEDKETIVPEELTVKAQLINCVTEIINKYLESQGISEENKISTTQNLTLEIPNDPLHGEYATSIAMRLAKILNKSPQQIAEEIVALFPQMEMIEKIEIAGPGFINFHLSLEFYKDQLKKILQYKSNYGRLNIGKDKKVIIEYSQPNIAKPLGVHHLLSTIIGQTLVHLYRFGGFEVIATNYPGDWGTQFGKLIYAYKTWGNEEIVKKDPLNELLKLYVQFHNEAEKDPSLNDKGRDEFKKLEEKDEENRKLWQWIKDLSIQEVERLYQKLGVHFDLYLSESMHLEQAKQLIQEGQSRGIIEVGEKEALIVKFENDKLPPYLMQKADGTTLYSSRDLASIKYRIDNFQPARVIYVVDVAQSLHFKQLFETAAKFGFTQTELVHVSFGRMQFPEGRMSTRKGEVVLLDEVIKEAITRTETIIHEKSQNLPEEEQKIVAEKMAISAIKYNIMSQNRETNMIFEWDRMLSLDGNSAPYLQYAYARTQSILRKYKEEQEKQTLSTAKKEQFLAANETQTTLFTLAEEQKSTTDQETKNSSETGISSQKTDNNEEDTKRQPFAHSTERKLLQLFIQFPQCVEQAIIHYKPNLLTNYLFELARAFSSFYNELPVLNAGTKELKSARLQLVEATAQILHNGLKLLDISTFDRM